MTSYFVLILSVNGKIKKRLLSEVYVFIGKKKGQKLYKRAYVKISIRSYEKSRNIFTKFKKNNFMYSKLAFQQNFDNN